MDVTDFLNKRKFTVLLSGGKDSTATLLWILNNINHSKWNILYVEVTGNTSPICTQYVYDICDKLDVSDRLVVKKRLDVDFYEYMRKYGPPIVGYYRWCLYQFKIPLMKKYSYNIVVDGLRKNENAIRKKLGSINISKLLKKVSVHPVYEWTEKHIEKYILQNNIPINPCYYKYAHGGNCMFCPYFSRKQIILTLNDEYWRDKILSSLKYSRGRISAEIHRKYMKYSKQKLFFNFTGVNYGTKTFIR